ncbi:MAG: hypothetical protein EBV53_13055, partial [Proteobacteria bacterium]|nr:hypothetical protein [Pseudomonadota bacterium]
MLILKIIFAPQFLCEANCLALVNHGLKLCCLNFERSVILAQLLKETLGILEVVRKFGRGFELTRGDKKRLFHSKPMMP